MKREYRKPSAKVIVLNLDRLLVGSIKQITVDVELEPIDVMNAKWGCIDWTKVDDEEEDVYL